MPGLLALIVWRPSTKSPPTTPGALQSAACYPDRVRTSLGGIPVSAHSPSPDAEATMAASSKRRAAICIGNERSVRTRPNFGEEERTVSKKREREREEEKKNAVWKGLPPRPVSSAEEVLPEQGPPAATCRSWRRHGSRRRLRPAASAMAHAGASCSVRIDRTLRPVEAGVCVVERDFGLVQQRNGTMGVSMWLTKEVCAGLFRCCGVHVLCMMTADARRPTMCRCKQADSTDLRPFEARASSCELVVRHCAPAIGLPSESPLNMCMDRRRSRVGKDPADSARRTAASPLFRERATAIHRREAACGLPEAAMAPFASPLARRCLAELTERHWSIEDDLSPFSMANTIAGDRRR